MKKFVLLLAAAAASTGALAYSNPTHLSFDSSGTAAIALTTADTSFRFDLQPGTYLVNYTLTTPDSGNNKQTTFQDVWLSADRRTKNGSEIGRAHV